MTDLVFTDADFELAVNLTLNGVDVEGQPNGLTSSQRAAIIENLRTQGIDTQPR